MKVKINIRLLYVHLNHNLCLVKLAIYPRMSDKRTYGDIFINHTMKRIVITFIAIFSLICAHAQNTVYADPHDPRQKTVIDEVKYRFTYRTMFSEDTIGRGKFYDNQALEIGSKHVRYYSIFAETIDSTWYKYTVTGEKSSPGGSYRLTEDLQPNETGQYEDLFFDYPATGTLTVVNAIYKKTYTYSEPVPSFEWEITGRTAQVLGYECHEAVADFRGRKWHAWFTYDIPLRYGPWKLGGLPGLILRAEDADSLYTYELIGIQEPHSESMYKYEIRQAIKCEREDILRINDMRWQDPVRHATSNGMSGMLPMMRDPNTGKLRKMTTQEYTAYIGYIPQRELE